MSPGFGSAITYASLIGKKEDVYKASAIVCVSNSAFSILAGFAIFSIVGGVAHENDITVEEAATEVGTGLAFFTIAKAMSLFGNVSFKDAAFNFHSEVIESSIFSDPCPYIGEKRHECFILRHAVHSWIGEIIVLDFHSFAQLLAFCLSYIRHNNYYPHQDSSYANFETLVTNVKVALHRRGYKPPLWHITLSMSVVSKSFTMYCSCCSCCYCWFAQV